MGIISWYSTGVWKFIDDYFRNEYKAYLSKEFKRNKHLQLKLDEPTVAPKPAEEESVKPFLSHKQEETCEADLFRRREKLDYHNYQRTNDRQSRDEDGFVSYWLERKGKDKSDFNLHCREEATCEDN